MAHSHSSLHSEGRTPTDGTSVEEPSGLDPVRPTPPDPGTGRGGSLPFTVDTSPSRGRTSSTEPLRGPEQNDESTSSRQAHPLPPAPGPAQPNRGRTDTPVPTKEWERNGEVDTSPLLTDVVPR